MMIQGLLFLGIVGLGTSLNADRLARAEGVEAAAAFSTSPVLRYQDALELVENSGSSSKAFQIRKRLRHRLSQCARPLRKSAERFMGNGDFVDSAVEYRLALLIDPFDANARAGFHTAMVAVALRDKRWHVRELAFGEWDPVAELAVSRAGHVLSLVPITCIDPSATEGFLEYFMLRRRVFLDLFVCSGRSDPDCEN